LAITHPAKNEKPRGGKVEIFSKKYSKYILHKESYVKIVFIITHKEIM